MIRILLLALALGVAAMAAPRTSKDMPTRPLPLTISTLPSHDFSVEGKFDGTFQVHPGYIEVDLQSAWIQVMGTAKHLEPRRIHDIKIGLAETTAKGWSAPQKVTFAAANKVMKVGEVLRLTPKPVRIPITASLDLSSLWFVVEIGVSNTDLNNPNKPHSGVCYAHSKKGVFAAAK